MRLLKGHPGELQGCDIDPRHVAWMQSNLDYCRVQRSSVNPPLPYAAATFDAVISISVFSHLNEASQTAFLAELARITKPGATLMLTIHGEAAMRRARAEKGIFDMIAVPREAFDEAGRRYDAGDYAFILQQGHLTRQAGTESSASILAEEYEYGITFIPRAYLDRVWARHFKLVRVVEGGLHDFQDIVVLQR